jgi:hypothetical protein
MGKASMQMRSCERFVPRTKYFAAVVYSENTVGLDAIKVSSITDQIAHD